MIKELKNVRYQRAVIPEDAETLNSMTLDFGDASKSLVCASIYVRFKRKCGKYSCQLLFSRSRLVPKTELYAALINTHTGEVVKTALKKFHEKPIKFTDIQIVLCWWTNENHSLKKWVQNIQL